MFSEGLPKFSDFNINKELQIHQSKSKMIISSGYDYESSHGSNSDDLMCQLDVDNDQGEDDDDDDDEESSGLAESYYTLEE